MKCTRTPDLWSSTLTSCFFLFHQVKICGKWKFIHSSQTGLGKSFSFVNTSTFSPLNVVLKSDIFRCVLLKYIGPCHCIDTNIQTSMDLWPNTVAIANQTIKIKTNQNFQNILCQFGFHDLFLFSSNSTQLNHVSFFTQTPPYISYHSSVFSRTTK